MNGFKNFILRGNLVELAVALVMALAFTAVVKATVDLIMGLIGKIGGQPDFTGWHPGGLPFGAWVTAVISFVVIAAVVYFLVVKPVQRLMDRFKTEPDIPSTTKECPECLSSIPLAATRCAFCTVEQLEAA
jgi:large conductance mechanosensitive channel